MRRVRHKRDPLVVSLLDIPRDVIARKLFGSDAPADRRRVVDMLSGRKQLTLVEFMELYRAFPFVDLERSMQDLYDKALVARARRAQKSLTSVDGHARADTTPGDDDHAEL